MEITRCLVSLMLHSKDNKLPWWIFIKHKLVICYPITWLQRYVVPSFKSRVHQAVWHTAPSHEAAAWIKHMYSDMEMFLLHFLSGCDTGPYFTWKHSQKRLWNCMSTFEWDNKTFRLPSDFTFLYLRFIFITIKTFQFKLGSIDHLKWEFMWLCRTYIGPGRYK